MRRDVDTLAKVVKAESEAESNQHRLLNNIEVKNRSSGGGGRLFFGDLAYD